MTLSEKIDSLLAEGVPADRIEELLAPPAPRKPVDERVLRSCLALDIADRRVEDARRDEHVRLQIRLRRLGLDASRLRPPPAVRQRDRHLAKALEGVEPPTLRRAQGEVLRVR